MYIYVCIYSDKNEKEVKNVATNVDTGFILYVNTYTCT